MTTNANNFVNTGKLNDSENAALHECVTEGVDFILRIMNSDGKKGKNYNDIYGVNLSCLRLYANEFAELAKNNKIPMITKLYNECIYNIERLYFVQQNIDAEKEKAKKIKNEMAATNDKKRYDDLKKQYDDSIKNTQNMKECMNFTNLETTPPRYYDKGFNHFICKHQKLRNIMIKIKDAIEFE